MPTCVAHGCEQVIPMFWYGPGSVFLLSVMTLNCAEGFRASSSVRAGLFQGAGVSAKVMKTQPKVLKCCVERPYESKVGPAKLEDATAACAVGFGAPPSRPDCLMTSMSQPDVAFDVCSGFRYPEMPVSSELLGWEDTITFGLKMSAMSSESRFWPVLGHAEGRPEPVFKHMDGDNNLVSREGTTTAWDMNGWVGHEERVLSMASRGALSTMGVLVVVPWLVGSTTQGPSAKRGFGLMAMAVLLTSLDSTQAVCPTCKDTIAGCQGGVSCPLIKDFTDNTELFNTNRMDARPKVSQLLTQEAAATFLCVITDAIVGLANAPAPGMQVDLESRAYATPSAVVRAASCGHCSVRSYSVASMTPPSC